MNAVRTPDTSTAPIREVVVIGSGPDLIAGMRTQVERFGADIVDDDIGARL